MIITDPNQLDLTGEKSNYKRNLRRFKIFTDNQLVELNDSAYLNKLVVYEVTGFDEYNNPVLVKLNKGNYAKEWSTPEDCHDITAMAKAKSRYAFNPPEYMLTVDEAFQTGKQYYAKVVESGIESYVLYTDYTVGTAIPANTYYEKDQETWEFTLVNKFYMNDSASDIAASGEYEIAVEYNGLEIECDAIERDGLGPEYSPGLMRSIINKVEELYYVRNSITNVSATSISQMHCLEEDLTGSKPANFIQGEVHTVDVPNNLFVIRPQCGSFYNTSTLKLESVSAGTTTVLVKDTDYVVTGINKEKTAISFPDVGVYEYIVLKKEFVGTILVTYQAFGGEVTQFDINALKDIIQSVYQLVSSKDIVTTANLSSTSVIKELIYRQQLLEHTIGHFQSQRFIYTSGVLDKWVNIAFVDRNPWTADAPVPTSCIGEFRVKIAEMDLFMDVKISYDVNATDGFSVSVYHADVPTFANNGFDYFVKRLLPKFRLIWCENGYTEGDTAHPNTDRGIMLQMSLTSMSTNTFTVIVDDMTGAKSPWDLVDTLGRERPSIDDQSVEYYTNDAVTYGDYIENPSTGIKTYRFDWKSATDKQSSIVPLYPKGYTIFVGSIPIDRIELLSVTHSDAETGSLPVNNDIGYLIPHSITGTDIDLSKVKAVEFKVFDRLTEKYLIGRSQSAIASNRALSAEALYFVDDLCMLLCRLAFNGSDYTVHVRSKTGTNSLNNKRFDLVQIDLIG